MTPKSILPQNEILLRKRFPVVLQRILNIGNKMPQDFFYEDSESESSKVFRKIFGTDFPEVEDVKKSSVKPFVVTGNNA